MRTCHTAKLQIQHIFKLGMGQSAQIMAVSVLKLVFTKLHNVSCASAPPPWGSLNFDITDTAIVQVQNHDPSHLGAMSSFTDPQEGEGY